MGEGDTDAAGGGAGGGGMPDDEGKLGAGGSSYVPPHLRKGGAGAGERMGGGKYERDDLATLRVTNVSCGLRSSWSCYLLGSLLQTLVPQALQI